MQCCAGGETLTPAAAFAPGAITLSCSGGTQASPSSMGSAEGFGFGSLNGRSTDMSLLLPDEYFEGGATEGLSSSNSTAVASAVDAGGKAGGKASLGLGSQAAPRGCHLSSISPQLGWTACVCEAGVACQSGQGGCLEQAGHHFWVQDRCTDCRCAVAGQAPLSVKDAIAAKNAATKAFEDSGCGADANAAELLATVGVDCAALLEAMDAAEAGLVQAQAAAGGSVLRAAPGGGGGENPAAAGGAVPAGSSGDDDNDNVGIAIAICVVAVLAAAIVVLVCFVQKRNDAKHPNTNIPVIMNDDSGLANAQYDAVARPLLETGKR